MIRRAQDVERFEKEMFGGPGRPLFSKILNEDEFAGKGRLYSHVVLRPGDAVGVHRHTGEFEVYYILKGDAVYNDNGTEITVRAGDVTVCPDGETHGIANRSDKDVELTALILFTA